MDEKTNRERKAILAEMGRITQMAGGALSEEYRSRGRGKRALGPYYKHQEWIGGQNVSRRVGSEDAESLGVGIAERKRFEELAARFVALTIAASGKAAPKRKLAKVKSRLGRPGKG